jgi:hypothetical protein
VFDSPFLADELDIMVGLEKLELGSKRDDFIYSFYAESSRSDLFLASSNLCDIHLA